ncbi:hypothetical protein [Nostoc sp.]|uniref:hypothetical protein n=1 Tax=Nostoc sp. TaxID=1180 RepID=UPI002FF6F0C3
MIAPYALTWFEVIGYTVLLEPDIALGKHQIGRSNYTEVVLYERLHSALQKINPTKPDEAIAAAIYQGEQCENVRSGFNYQLHRHILNKTRFISLRSHPEIPISVLGFSTSQNRIAPSIRLLALMVPTCWKITVAFTNF